MKTTNDVPRECVCGTKYDSSKFEILFLATTTKRDQISKN